MCACQGGRACWVCHAGLPRVACAQDSSSARNAIDFFSEAAHAEDEDGDGDEASPRAQHSTRKRHEQQRRHEQHDERARSRAALPRDGDSSHSQGAVGRAAETEQAKQQESHAATRPDSGDDSDEVLWSARTASELDEIMEFTGESSPQPAPGQRPAALAVLKSHAGATAQRFGRWRSTGQLLAIAPASQARRVLSLWMPPPHTHSLA